MTMRSFLRTCLIVVATIFLATEANATWTFVRGTQQTSGSGTSASLTITAPTSGDILACTAFITPQQASNVITSITDNQSNTYVVVDYQTANPNLATFWSNGRLTNGPTSVTVNLSVTSTNLWMSCSEFTPSAGTLALDGHAIASGSSAAPSSGNLTTASNGDLIYSGTVDNGTSAAGSGFTISTGNGGAFADEFQVQSAAGSIAGTWTANSGAWTAGAFAVKITASTTNKGPINLPVVGVGGD